MTKTGRWLADWMADDGAIDRLPDGWDDPHALVAKVEAEAIEPLLALVRAARGVLPEVMEAEIGTAFDPSLPFEVSAARVQAKADRWTELDRALAALPESVRVAARKP